jgi:hypothetical protein
MKSNLELVQELEKFAAMPYWNEYESEYVVKRLIPEVIRALEQKETVK